MHRPRFVDLLLVVAGLVAVGIGGTVLAAPEAFYASSGVTLTPDVSLLSEIRAPGGALLSSGLLMLLGVFVQSFFVVSLSLGATIYLGYGVARLLGMIIDGLPDAGLVVATGVELAIGALCLVALLGMKPWEQEGL